VIKPSLLHHAAGHDPEAVADAILNHRQSATRGGVLGVYQLAQRWPEQVAAMKHWGDALLDAINSDGVKLNFTNDRGEPS